MKKGNLIGLFLLLAFIITGCSDSVSDEMVKEEISGYYYAIEESIVPDVEDSISVPEGGHVLCSSPILFGKDVLCTVAIYDEKHQNTDFYIQIVDENTGVWKSIDVINSAFEWNGTKYDGINSQISDSADNEMYVQSYILDDANYLCRIGANGVEEVLCKVSENFAKDWDPLTSVLTRDKDGNFYSFSGNSKVLNCYDSNLNETGTVEATKEIYGILQGSPNAMVYWYGNGADNKPIMGSLTDEKILFESIEGLATEYKAGISSGDTIFMADTQNVWRVIDGVPQKVFQFAVNGYYINELYGMEIVSDEEILFLVKMDGELMFLRMTEIDEPIEKQEIVIAFATPHLGLDKSIARFNRQNDYYHVTVMLPEEDEEEEAFRKRIQMDMAADKGPDILGHDMVTNVSDYVENGYLECLDDVIEDRSMYLEAALKASEIDGSFYGIPYECSFDVVAYSADTTNGRTAWNLSELIQIVENSDAEILQEGMDGVDIICKYALYDNSNTEFINWENGESFLTEEDFINVLEFAKAYADTQEGEQQAFAKTIVAFEELQRIKSAYTYFEEGAMFIGYPKSEGNGIYVEPKTLYLNAASDCKEGAKEFLKFIISEEEQQKYVTYNAMEQMEEEGVTSLYGHFTEFPIALKAFDTLVEVQLEKDQDNIIHTDSGTVYADILYTDAMIEQFYFMIEHAEPANYNAEAIEGMISEELEPYFAGAISAQDAAEKLDNRVQLYLDETIN